MFWNRSPAGASHVQEMTPAEVHDALALNKIVLVDVREPAEHAADLIAGSLLQPLSTFDPAALPSGGDKQVVLYCRSGMRSRKALARCLACGVPVNTHLAGGIMAWKHAGLPTVSQPR